MNQKIQKIEYLQQLQSVSVFFATIFDVHTNRLERNFVILATRARKRALVNRAKGTARDFLFARDALRVEEQLQWENLNAKNCHQETMEAKNSHVFDVGLARLTTTVPKTKLRTEPVSHPRRQHHRKQHQNNSTRYQTEY